jgi:hypothetical protein
MSSRSPRDRPPFSAMRPRRFRLGAMLWAAVAVTLLCAAGVSYLRKLNERRLVAAIKKSGDASVWYDYEWREPGGLVGGQPHPIAPAWIRRVLGDDFFGHPIFVRSFPETPDGLLRVIGQLPSLTGVDLSGLAAASEPFKATSTLPQLHWLELSGPIDFHDLADAPPMRDVKILELREMCVTDAACRLIVQKFPAVSELDIEGTNEGDSQPSDIGLSAVRRLPNLARLSVVASCGVSYNAINSFSGSPTLVHLCAEVRGDVDEARVRIHDCPLLERLEISQCDPFYVGSAHPWRLSLDRVPRIKEVSVQNVVELRLGAVCNLEMLSLTDCDVPVADLSQVAACGSLTKVELDRFRGDSGAVLRELGKISSLKVLALRCTALTAGDMKRIGSFRQLEELDLTSNRGVDDSCLRELEGLKRLRSLKVWGTNVTAAGVRRIESVLPGVRCTVVNPYPGMLSGAAAGEAAGVTHNRR